MQSSIPIVAMSYYDGIILKYGGFEILLLGVFGLYRT